MLIVMDAAATAEDVQRVVETVQGLGLSAHPIPGAQRTAIGITGNRGSVEAGAAEAIASRRLQGAIFEGRIVARTEKVGTVPDPEFVKAVRRSVAP